MKNNNEITLTVEGMSCSACERHVNTALRELDGVEDVDVDLDTGRVTVKHDPDRAAVEAMLVALEEAGYASRPAA